MFNDQNRSKKNYSVQKHLMSVFYSVCGFLKVKHLFRNKMACPAFHNRTLPLKLDYKPEQLFYEYYNLLEYNNQIRK